MNKLTILAVSVLLSTACQSPIPQAGKTITPAAAPVAPLLLQSTHIAKPKPGAYTSPVLDNVMFQPEGKVRIQGSQVTLQIQLPPRTSFRTQALYLDDAELITATVRDSHGKTYSPVGADGNGRVIYPTNGLINLSFENVLPDPLLWVELQVRDLGGDIPQADLAAVISHLGASDINTTINFQTTPTAKVMKAIWGAPHNNPARARSIDLTALAALMTTITGYTAGPPVAYTTHPSLVDTDALATGLIANEPATLTASAATYRRVGATISLDVSGLVGSDKLDVQISDAASLIASGLGNGNDQLVVKGTPGAGLGVKVGFASGNSTQYTYTATPSTVTMTNGAVTDVVVTAIPANVTIGSLSPTFGAIGSTVTITGTGFSTEESNNRVAFDGVAAVVTSATNTTLAVTVPAGVSGSADVTVEVGAATSNTALYQVRPTITSVVADSGSTGDSITITGTGFSNTLAEHTVRVGGVAATVNTASPTVLTATLNEAPAGVGNATVQVGTQTSLGSVFTLVPKLISLTTASQDSGKAILVRSRPLVIVGTNFDLTPANNKVQLTLANSTLILLDPTLASATSLTVMIPSSVDVQGDVGVLVRTHSQTSNTLLGTVPTVTLNVTNGGFK